MSDPSCSGPMCTYTGTRMFSHAWKGRCTDTRGYISNAEINEIIADKANYATVKSYYDADSDSNILMYGNDKLVDWVAYLDGDVKAKRMDWIKSHNFLGTSDWAIDLQTFDFEDGAEDPDGTDWDNVDWGIDFDYAWPLRIQCFDEFNPGTLDGIANQLDKMPVSCQQQYTLKVLQDMVNSTLAEFNDITSGIYDDQFNHYVSWLKDHISDRLEDYMELGKGKGNAFFNCDWQVTGGSDSGSGPCSKMEDFWNRYDGWKITYKLTDENGFYDAIQKDLGYEREWVAFDGHKSSATCDSSTISDAPPRNGGGTSVCMHRNQEKYNFPQKTSDNSKIVIPDPKAQIQASMTNITSLQVAMTSNYADMVMATYNSGSSGRNDDTDPVTAVSMPVLQLQSIIDNIKEIKEIGQKAIDEDRKNLILKVIGIILLVVPFVGEVIGLAGEIGAQIARIVLLITDLANVGTTIAEIVEDPASAPFAIMGLLGGIGGGKGGGSGKIIMREGIETSADIRKALTVEKLAKFPPAFREKDALLQKITKRCK